MARIVQMVEAVRDIPRRAQFFWTDEPDSADALIPAGTEMEQIGSDFTGRAILQTGKIVFSVLPGFTKITKPI